MLKRYLFTTLVVALAAVTLTACSTAQHAGSTPPAQKTALWKVTSAQRTMYITGSVGASLKKYPLPATITQAFAKSGELIMEGKTDASKKKKKALLMKYGLQPSGQKLSDQLSAAQLKLVKQAFSSAPTPLPFAIVQHFRPWMAVMVLANARGKELGVKRHQLYTYFHSRARDRNMPVSYLNTVAGEFKLYANMPQVPWLMMTAKKVLKPEHPKKRRRRIEAWRSGNTSVLARQIDKAYQDYPRVYDTLITSYEPRWLKMLEAELDQSGEPVFVIVNGPNLVGRENILKGLRKAGYQVTQL